jgi:hypothetical protein
MDNTRAVLQFRGEYVLPVEKAVEIMRLLSDAETYERKWHSGKDGAASFYTHHVYSPEERSLSLSLMTNGSYAMFKAAGNPNKD